MKRIYSNYSEDDYKMIEGLAKKLGFSLSAFQQYCVMLYAGEKGESTFSSDLLNEMLANMKKISVGQTFIVSALLPDKWPKLERNTKMFLAKQLALHIRKNSNFEIHKVSKGQVTVYKRVSKDNNNSEKF